MVDGDELTVFARRRLRRVHRHDPGGCAIDQDALRVRESEGRWGPDDANAPFRQRVECIAIGVGLVREGLIQDDGNHAGRLLVGERAKDRCRRQHVHRHVHRPRRRANRPGDGRRIVLRFDEHGRIERRRRRSAAGTRRGGLACIRGARVGGTAAEFAPRGGAPLSASSCTGGGAGISAAGLHADATHSHTSADARRRKAQLENVDCTAEERLGAPSGARAKEGHRLANDAVEG